MAEYLGMVCHLSATLDYSISIGLGHAIRRIAFSEFDHVCDLALNYRSHTYIETSAITYFVKYSIFMYNIQVYLYNS